MLLQPSLILADEPTASLDDAACDTVATLLATAARETGAALLIATHDARLRHRFGHEVTVESVGSPSGSAPARGSPDSCEPPP
jgi:ABC-type lipoprotein export system ATPase subunit